MERYELGKKGIFLTFISITIIAVFLVVFSTGKVDIKKDISPQKLRIDSLDDFVSDVGGVYMESTLQATGIKTIHALIEYMRAENKFLDNFEASFEEVALEGTINGDDIDTFLPDGKKFGDNTLTDWIDKLELVSADTFNAVTDIIIDDVTVFQDDPWYVTVEADIRYTVDSEAASWDKNKIISTMINIENFLDPYYLVSLDYENTIKRSTVKVGEWDATKVTNHIKEGEYVHLLQSNAPNFIMRFKDPVVNPPESSSCCGIEGIVNSDIPGVGTVDESYADYLFFSNAYDCEDLYELDATVWPSTTGASGRVRLELEHLADYNMVDDADPLVCN